MQAQRGLTIAIVGPTASGKSALAVEVARELDSEIVNADSMQLYRGLDIGTGKVTESERRGIPHHLLDIWELSHLASVQEYQQRARDAIHDVHARGKAALLVGGSGLYVSAVLDDLRFPGTDKEVRERWEAKLAEVGPEALHDELAQRDPAAAAAILPGNGRRIVRALEVLELTGEPFQATLGSQQRLIPATVIGLQLDRVVLDQRINDRVAAMWTAGWVAEARQLMEVGLASAPTASRALGYQQILRMFAGEIDEDQALTETATATRRFARKQMSWFRRDSSTRWLDVTSGRTDSTDVLALVKGGQSAHSSTSRSPW